jgi:hypothetical protein
MSRRVFNAGQEKFLEIFVHEMCHQAVSEIDRVVDINKGHGPYWKAWMVKSGIPPSRYDYTDAQEYMNDEERARHQEKLDALKRAQLDKERLQKISHLSRIGTPAQFFWAEKDKWVQGVIVGVFATKFYIVTNKDTGAYMTLGNQGRDRIYAIPPGEENENYLSEVWQNAALRVKRYLDNKAAARKANREDDPLGRSLRNLLGY